MLIPSLLLLLPTGLLPQHGARPAWLGVHGRAVALGVTRTLTPLLQNVDSDTNETIVEASRATGGVATDAVINVSVRTAESASKLQGFGAPLARLALRWSSAKWVRALFATGFVCGFASVAVSPQPASFSIPGAIAGAWQWGANLVLLVWALARLALARLLVWLTSGFADIAL